MLYTRSATFSWMFLQSDFTFLKNGKSLGHHLTMCGPVSFSPQRVQSFSKSVKCRILPLEGSALKAILHWISLILGGISFLQRFSHLTSGALIPPHVFGSRATVLLGWIQLFPKMNFHTLLWIVLIWLGLGATTVATYQMRLRISVLHTKTLPAYVSDFLEPSSARIWSSP